MRTRKGKRDFDYTFKKPRLEVGAHFRILENKNECVRRDAGQNLTTLLLHWNVWTCAPIRNTYVL